MTLPNGYTLRAAGPADAAVIHEQRTAMFTDMGLDPARLAQVHEAGVAWHTRALTAGTYSGRLIERGGHPVAGAGILWMDLPPTPDSPGSTRAYVMNVYVHPGHRGRRLARILMNSLLGECRARGVTTVTLTASHAGRPTYEALGFTPLPELKLVLSDEVTS